MLERSEILQFAWEIRAFPGKEWIPFYREKKHVNMLLPTFEKFAWKMTRTFVNLNVCDDI